MADAATATRHRQARSKLLAHALLILGVLIFAFPIWIALMGSTHDASTLGRGEVPLLPGPDAVENYATALEEVLRLKPSASKGRYITKAVLSTTMGPGIPLDHTRTKALLEEAAPVAAAEVAEQE